MSEFEFIARHLAPLAGEGAHDLKDDAAEAFGRVLTKDLLVEGVHFLPSDPLDLVARKALRVNISDIIAKGAAPTGYMLGLVWPKGTGEEAFCAFARGLAAEQEASGLALLGGDTTSGPVFTISVTMFGVPGPGGMVKRSGGKPGDLLAVTGTIGDGLLGLEAARGAPPAEDASALPYRLPAIPFGVQDALARHASAALDVSDGLVADAAHLAGQSGVTLEIRAEDVPLSAAGRAAHARLGELLTAGDDYQTLFLIPGERIAGFRAELPETLSVTVIGEAKEGLPDVRVLGIDGRELPLRRGGWDHFSSEER